MILLICHRATYRRLECWVFLQESPQECQDVSRCLDVLEIKPDRDGLAAHRRNDDGECISRRMLKLEEPGRRPGARKSRGGIYGCGERGRRASWRQVGHFYDASGRAVSFSSTYFGTSTA